MKVQAVIETGSTRIVLTPENDGEKRILGLMVEGDVRADIGVKHEGHYSNAVAEVVTVTLTKIDATAGPA